MFIIYKGMNENMHGWMDGMFFKWMNEFCDFT
jgi:hypothetical protein